jgi:hypothetical protein
MPQTTYRQTILSYFASFDIANLRIHLKEEYSYQDTTKFIFLSKLDQIFNKFKNAGDSELLIYPGACAGKACDNCGVKGYRFVGNYSKNYIDLLFVIISDDIRDIFYCSSFNPDVELDGLQRKESIFIDKDDLVTFHKTPEYWEKVFAAYNAYSELVEDPPKPFDYDFLSHWLNKYSELNSKLGKFSYLNPTMKWSSFSRLYDELIAVRVYIPTHILAILHANYTLAHAKTEDERIAWVLKHETTHEKIPFLFKRSFDKEGENYIMTNQNPVLILTGKVFIEALNFAVTYKEQQAELLQKYTTYTSEMEAEILNNTNFDEEGNNVFSLRFHLERREEIEKLGENIPLFINEKRNQIDS